MKALARSVLLVALIGATNSAHARNFEQALLAMSSEITKLKEICGGQNFIGVLNVKPIAVHYVRYDFAMGGFDEKGKTIGCFVSIEQKFDISDPHAHSPHVFKISHTIFK